jgi:long-chain acyl-CoA synthetase
LGTIEGGNEMGNARFWTKSYDPGLTDLDPREWETSYVKAVEDVFTLYPGKTALAYMGTHITFAELDRYANRFAHMLHTHGFVKGDVVGINLPNIPEYVIAWLGTLRAGCIVSGVSPLLSPEEMEYQLMDAKAKGLVTLDAIFAGRLTKIADNLPDLKVVVAASIGGFLPVIKRILGKLLKKIPTGKVSDLTGKTVYRMEAIIKGERFPAAALKMDLSPDDIAYLQYTGGTTGAPKGAMLSHRNAVADLVIVQRWLGWERGVGTALSGFPFFHIAGLFFNENNIYLGWTQVLIPNPRDTDHICTELRKYQPKALVNVPSLFQMLMENPKFKTLDFSKLEVCISAAAPFPEESQRRLEEIVGQGKLMEVYGMTETAPLTTMNPYRGRKQLGSIGLPLLNTEILLLDPGTGKPVAPGQPGEICIKGPQVMVGYFNKPQETRQVMDTEGYLHTGDVAIQDDDGYLRIVDRTKDMIIVGGFKVFSTKVEEVLSRHPAVNMAALIGIDNPERLGSELVMAYITLNAEYQTGRDVEALKEELLSYAREKLSPYEIPKTVEIRAELPLTTVGKVDKKLLRKEARAKS